MFRRSCGPLGLMDLATLLPAASLELVATPVVPDLL